MWIQTFGMITVCTLRAALVSDPKTENLAWQRRAPRASALSSARIARVTESMSDLAAKQLGAASSRR